MAADGGWRMEKCGYKNIKIEKNINKKCKNAQEKKLKTRN